jgi:hypothetical protein
LYIIEKIPEFPRYGVTVDGKVINFDTDREMVLSPTQNGDLTVGMMLDGVQYRRSVKVLVAEAFVDGRSSKDNTAMLLNGDKRDLRAMNIVWRPRWFALKYDRELGYPSPIWFERPVRERRSGVVYDNIDTAAIIHGLLRNDILISIRDGRLVYPTGQVFEWF